MICILLQLKIIDGTMTENLSFFIVIILSMNLKKCTAPPMRRCQ